MSSYLLAIFSTRDGDPYAGVGDRIGHVVRIGDAAMPVVNEFTDLGAYEHEDCGPASIQSRLRQGGIVTSVRQIELLAGTGPKGTLFPGMERALRFFGVAEAFSPGPPLPGWIMNPAGGRLLDPIYFPAYLAVSQGGCIVMADQTTPPRPPVPLKEPLMQTFEILPGSDPTLIPGLTGRSTLNLVAYVATAANLFAWLPNGTPLASKKIALLGNVANQHGPEQASGYLYQLLGLAATLGPCTLALYPGAAPYTVSVY